MHKGADGRVQQSAYWLGGALSLQIVLGVTALMWVVPIGLAAAHQIGAVLVLGVAVMHLHFLRYPNA